MRSDRISRPHESRNGSTGERLATFDAASGAEGRGYIDKGECEMSEWDQEGQGGGLGGGSEGEDGGMGGEEGGAGGGMGGGTEEEGGTGGGMGGGTEEEGGGTEAGGGMGGGS